MQVEPSDIEACRQRGGEARSDRPEYVDDALKPDERLGFNEGAPLADRSYAAYPDDLYAEPEIVKPFLMELADHDLINNTSALAAELNGDEDTVADVAALYDIDLPRNGFDVRVSQKPDGAVVMPDGSEWPMDYLADDPATDPRLLSQLMATDGMSVEECATFLSRELRRIRGPDAPRGAWRVRPVEIKKAAKDCGLLPSDDSDTTADRPRAEAGIVPDEGVVIRADDIDDGPASP